MHMGKDVVTRACTFMQDLTPDEEEVDVMAAMAYVLSVVALYDSTLQQADAATGIMYLR